MEDLVIQKTDATPFITATCNGKITFEGISIPENVAKFYKPIYDWVEDFKKTNPEQLTLNLNFKYLNTVSAISIVNLFKKLNSFAAINCKVTVNWYYEKNDFEIRETGADFKTFVTFDYHLIEE